MFQSNNKSSSLGTILAPEIEIKGDITISDNIHSNGNINTAEGSVITGDITAKSLSISGTINGNLDIEEKVILNSSGCLNGNIKANIISIDEGASFEGMCNMLNHNETKVQKISNLSS